MKMRTLSMGALLLLSLLATAGFASAADIDGDGLDDDWEMAYFGHLNYGADDDPDGDLATNLEEFIAGTDPTDPLDAPRPPDPDHL